jgi:uncharacterized membrane protein YadS
MPEESKNEKSESDRKSGKYVPWFFISLIMVVIIYTTVMAVLKKFGGA